MRTEWTALLEAVTKRIAAMVDETDVTPASSSDHAEIAARVAGANGSVFDKVASSDLGVWSLRYERRASGPVTTPNSPAIEWDSETAGLLVVAFEHCAGPHFTLLPGNPDLDLLKAVLTERAETPAPDVSWLSPKSRLGCTHPAMDGDTLIDTDLTSANLIVTSASLHIVDSGYAFKAAPWLGPALLVQRLIGSCHTLNTWGTGSPNHRRRSPRPCCGALRRQGLGTRLLEHPQPEIDAASRHAYVEATGARASRMLVWHAYNPLDPFLAGPGPPQLYPMSRKPRRVDRPPDFRLESLQ